MSPHPKRPHHTTHPFFSIPHLQILIFHFISSYNDLLSYAESIHLDLFAYGDETTRVGALESATTEISVTLDAFQAKDATSSHLIPPKQFHTLSHPLIPESIYIPLLQSLYFSQYQVRLGCLEPNSHSLHWHVELQRINGLNERFEQFHLRHVSSVGMAAMDFILKRDFLISFTENKIRKYVIQREPHCGDPFNTASQQNYWHATGMRHVNDYTESIHQSVSFCNTSNFLLGAKRAMSNELLLVRWRHSTAVQRFSYLSVFTPDLKLVRRLEYHNGCCSFSFVSERTFVVHAGGTLVEMWHYETDDGENGVDAMEDLSRDASSPPTHQLVKIAQWNCASIPFSLAVPLRYSDAFVDGQYEFGDDSLLQAPVLLSLHQDRIQFWRLPTLRRTTSNPTATHCGSIDMSAKFDDVFLPSNYPLISFTEHHLMVVNSSSTDEEIDVYSLDFERAEHTKIHTVFLGRHRFKHQDFPMLRTRVSLSTDFRAANGDESCVQRQDYLLYEDARNRINLFDLSTLSVEHSFYFQPQRSPFYISSISFALGIRGSHCFTRRNPLWSLSLNAKIFSQCVHQESNFNFLVAIDFVDDILVAKTEHTLDVLQLMWPEEAAQKEKGNPPYSRFAPVDANEEMISDDEGYEEEEDDSDDSGDEYEEDWRISSP